VPGSRTETVQTPRPQVFTLAPGERLTFAGTSAPKFDRPALEAVIAWERGQVVLDNTALADAVAEMNRYSREQIVIEDPALGAIRVSGIFQAGDSADFVQAVVRAYHIKALRQPDAVVLVPRAADHTTVGTRR